jgi:sugar phosphate isomerase/epimerase
VGPTFDLATVLERAAEVGFDGIELGAFGMHPNLQTHATPEARTELRAAIAERGLAVSGVITFGTASIVRDPVPADYVRHFDESLAFCVDMGCSTFVVHTVDPPEVVAELGYETAFGRLERVWAECARKADSVGVTLAWEFEAGSVFNTAREVIAVAHALSGPGFGVLYDTVHGELACSLAADEFDGGQEALLQELKGTIAHVHIADTDGTLTPVDAGAIGYGDDADRYTTTHVALGEGAIDFERVLPALVEAGCSSGWWCVDLVLIPDPWRAAEASRAFLLDLNERAPLGLGH